MQRRLDILWMTALACIAGSALLAQSPASPPAARGKTDPTLFFVTDREPIADMSGFLPTARQQTDITLHFGTLGASGNISPMSKPAMCDALRRSVAMSKNKRVLVYIPGFTSSFATAGAELTRLSTEMDFSEVGVLYSWASSESTDVLRYLADIATLEKGTVKPLNASLRDLAGDCGGASIDVVTYGAGVRAVINAIKLDAAVSPSFKLNNLIAIVPDIDADALDDAFVRTIGQYARRTTFYVSATDPALIESKRRRTRTAADARGSAAPVLRVGDAAQRVWTATGVDVVDVSGFDASLGNPLSRDDASVVADLYQVLEGLEPSSRRYLRRVETPTASYWQLSR